MSDILIEADSASDGVEYVASAYQYTVAFCAKSAIELRELRGALPEAYIHRSVFHCTFVNTFFLRALVGCPEDRWPQALGADLHALNDASSTLVAELRYCAECMTNGWHSAMFQHAAVHSCPVHDKALQTGCPACRLPIKITPDAIASNHTFCPRCAHRLVDPVLLAEHLNDFLPDEFRCLRREILPRKHFVDSSGSRVEVSAQHALDMGTPALQHVGKHLCWPSAPTPSLRWREIESARGIYREVHEAPELISQARVRVLQEIEVCLKRHKVPVQWPATLVTASVGGVRIDQEMPACAAAYFRTVSTLGLRRALRGSVSQQLDPFAAWLPKLSVRNAQAVAMAQTRELFALSLCAIRRFDYTVEVAWNVAPSPAAFTPAWRTGFGEAGAQHVLWMRTRLDKTIVGRLIGRYARKNLMSLGSESAQEFLRGMAPHKRR